MGVKDKKTDALVSDEEGIPDGVDMNDPFYAEEFGDEFKNAEDSDKKSKKKKNKKKLEEEEELGPWQKYLQKKKDKKKERRKVKEKKTDALVSDEEGIPDGVDMNDPFFAE